MKAFRGQPGPFAAAKPKERQANLKISDIDLKFGGVTALSKINLSVQTGELVFLVGPNGAGKTSLLDCITGQIRPQKGNIYFNGIEITQILPHHLAQMGIARTFQGSELFPEMSVLSNMMLARHTHLNYHFGESCLFSKRTKAEEIKNRQRVEEIIDFLEIQPIRHCPAKSLPMGMRKRVDLGRALAMDPRLLILDEPFCGLDAKEKEDLVRFLMELNDFWNLTMLVVEHDLSLAVNISQKVIVFDFGIKIAEGSPDFVQKHPQVIKAYLGGT